MRVVFIAAAWLVFTASTWAAYNFGFETGSDTTSCVIGSIMIEGHDPKVEPDCIRADPERHQFRHAARLAWLWMIDDEVKQ